MTTVPDRDAGVVLWDAEASSREHHTLSLTVLEPRQH